MGRRDAGLALTMAPRTGMARSIAAGAVSQVLGLMLAFFTTPILVHGLGVADYGLWNVSMAVGAWVGFVNMLFSTCAIRFAGEALGQGDPERVREVYTAIRRWALVCGGCGAVLLVLGSEWLAGHVLEVAPNRIRIAQELIVLQALFAFCQIQSATGHGMIAAHQRLDVSYGIRTAGAWLQSGGAALVVLAGGGLLRVVGWIAALQALEWLAVTAYVFFRLQIRTKAAARGGSWIRWGGPLAAYGVPLLVGYLAAQLFLPMSRILVGSLRSMSEVAFLAVPLTIAINVKALSTYVAAAVMPAVSQAAGRGDPEALGRLYRRGLRWSWLAIVPPAGLAIALGDAFISRWIGADFGRQAAPVVAPLVLAVNAYYFSAMPEVVAQGIGKPLPWAAFTAVIGVLHVLFGRVWIADHGVAGAAYALLAAGLLLSLGLMLWMGGVLAIRAHAYLQIFDIRVVAATAAVAWPARWIVTTHVLPVGGIIAVGVLGLLAIAATAPIWLIEDERSWFAKHWPLCNGHKPFSGES